ncbi:MAG: hypothetical protein ACU0CI_02545 [Shimia sp.]
MSDAESATSLRIQLWGTFEVRRSDGVDVTPPRAKSQVLLALLASAEGLTRRRAWVRDKLWQGRDRDQANNSLRQALHDVRRCLGSAQGALMADRATLRLDPARVTLVPPPEAGAVFLDGLPAKEREVHLWLTRRRLDAAPLPHPPAPPLHRPELRLRRVAIRIFRGATPEADWIAASIGNQAADLLREALPAEVAITWIAVGASPAPTDAEADILTDLHVSPVVEGSVSLRLTAARAATGARIWSRAFQFTHAALQLIDDPNLGHAVTLLGEAIEAHLARTDPGVGDPVQGREASGLGPILSKIFSMDAPSLEEADKLLATFGEEMQEPTYMAWRAQLRIIQYIERHDLNRPALAEAAMHFVAKAQEADPFNANALSVAANVAHFLEVDSRKAARIAQRAVEQQPLNPLAQWALSTAALYVDDPGTATRHAELGARMTRHSKRRFWWELQRGATALCNNQLDTALEAFSFVHDAQPEFRPPLRYLIALHAHRGDLEHAAALVRRMQALESDFSVARLIEDRAYPASLLRRSPALDLGQLRAFL